MLDLNFVNPFILATVDVLQVQGGIRVEGGKPFIKGREPQPAFAIAGVIGLTSEQFKGVISLNFQEQFYLALISNMLGEKITEINAEVQDGAAEILNMVYGAAKTQLNPKGYTLQKAIPTVVRGAGLQMTHGDGKSPAIVIPMRSDHGQMHLEVSVDMQ